MSTPVQPETPVPPPAILLAEVRYSLPEMLAELTVDRATAIFSMEKLEQAEIKKAFQDRSHHRAKFKA